MFQSPNGIGRKRSVLTATLALAGVMILGTAAHAQERYKLDDGAWQKQAGLAPDSPEGKLQAIRKLLAEDKPGAAESAATDWIDANPDHVLLPEAYLLRGDALVAQRDYYKALFDYEYLIRTFPSSEQFMTALEREYNIGTLFVSGVKRKLWGLPIVPAEGEGEELFIRIQERAPGSAIGEQASMALADYYFKESDMENAATAYDLFLQNYPESEQRERAMIQLIRSNLATFKGPRFDASGLLDAQGRIKTFAKEYPASAERLGFDAILIRIDESLALKGYYNGQWYERVDKKLSAIYTYQRVVSDHPQTAAAQLAIKRLDKLGAPPVPGKTQTYRVEQGSTLPTPSVPNPDAADQAVPTHGTNDEVPAPGNVDTR